MNPTSDFTSSPQPPNFSAAIPVYLNSPILIMQSRINKNRLFGWIYIITLKPVNNSWELVPQNSFTVLQVYDRGIQPNPCSICWGLYPSFFDNLTNNGCCKNIAKSHLINKSFSFSIYHLCPHGTN